jgi:hypothetical protein
MQGVIEPGPGKALASIPGPMPNFGTYATVDAAILAACPLIMRQPHASIPVPVTNQNFDTYWRVSREYCAWLYAAKNEPVEMSLFATSAVQDEPDKRTCRLPAYVDDSRYPSESIAYLVILHSHPFDRELSKRDLLFLVQMAQLHGFTPPLQGQQVSISIVAFFGKESCEGFYQYLPARNSELIKVTAEEEGRWKETLVGHVRWNSDEDYTLER